jgi:hypothetical protein
VSPKRWRRGELAAREAFRLTAILGAEARRFALEASTHAKANTRVTSPISRAPLHGRATSVL